MSSLPMQRQRLLAAGDFYFGQGDLSLRTVLGSCVAITVWHPATRTGGMSHCLLPEMPASGDVRDALYVEGAVKRFLQHLLHAGVYPQNCVVKLFGGGNMFPQQSSIGFDVGPRNVEAARRLLKQAGFTIGGEHVGGIGHRVVIFDLASGDTWLRVHKTGDLQQAGMAAAELAIDFASV